MSNEAAEVGGILFSIATFAEKQGNRLLLAQALRTAHAAAQEVQDATDDPMLAAVLVLGQRHGVNGVSTG